MNTEQLIEEMTKQRDALDAAIEALGGNTPSNYYRPPSGTHMAVPRPVKRATNPDRSQRMKEAWERRRAAAASIAAQSQPSPVPVEEEPAPMPIVEVQPEVTEAPPQPEPTHTPATVKRSQLRPLPIGNAPVTKKRPN